LADGATTGPPKTRRMSRATGCAGIRIATVTTIGLATLAALLTQGGLGDLILDGIGRRFPTPIMVGSLLAIALAVAADLLLLGAQRLVSPWARARRPA